MKSAIITGSNGQDGHYLSEILKHYHVEPVLVPKASGIDLTNVGVVTELVSNVKPEYIFHLAAHSTTDHGSALSNHDVIATGSLVLLEAARLVAPKCRVFLAGSAYQFKMQDRPISETDPLDNTSVYCESRAYSHGIAKVYRGMGLSVYFGYLFHHESPRRGINHLSQKISRAARRRAMIEVGDASMIKEWTWAGDTMNAVWSLVNQDKIWEANIGTGIGQSIADFADLCFSLKGLDWREFVKENKDRDSRFKTLTANPERIHSTGWRPERDLQYLAEQMVNSHE